MTPLDETHDPTRKSWVESANDAATDFPIQNLPFGVFRRADSDESFRVGVAIGDQIVDVVACSEAGLLSGDDALAADRCRHPGLNALMEAGPEAARRLRRALSDLLRVGSSVFERDPAIASHILVPMKDAELTLPAAIGDYTDFYASIQHATNVGSMFRPDNPLLPNYKWVPIGYHGRASSIVASGSGIRRPLGQTRDGTDGPPSFGPSRRLDYELEMGVFIGSGNALGSPIPIDEAERHVFGLCLLNDWSARDIQTWEYQPLGPFLAKNFATTLSPWVVTVDALAPYRAPAYRRPTGDPAPLPYLYSHDDTNSGGFDISLELDLSSAAMRDGGMKPLRVSTGSFTEIYWTVAQLVTHHASNGCNLRAGDLLGSGTVSGAAKESRGSLLERTWRGTEPLQLPTGETRAFLEDGDEVTIRGYCARGEDGRPRIGFGECRGRVLPALPAHASAV
ncbi:MAG: fumarylacetoacetase [Gemmatimonadetes bacterium]|nr:fumarylacetoacetase [Gemmatimonadota bacterium]